MLTNIYRMFAFYCCSYTKRVWHWILPNAGFFRGEIHYVSCYTGRQIGTVWSHFWCKLRHKPTVQLTGVQIVSEILPRIPAVCHKFCRLSCAAQQKKPKRANRGGSTPLRKKRKKSERHYRIISSLHHYLPYITAKHTLQLTGMFAKWKLVVSWCWNYQAEW